MRQRLDQLMSERGMVGSRSEAGSWIRLGKVVVDGKRADKAGLFVDDKSQITLETEERYVSRAALKLSSVAKTLGIDFKDTVVLDVGSSTGGFTDFALQHGARKVYAVDVGTDQLHPSLRRDKRIELHEKTDIRNFKMRDVPDIIVMDVSFISVRELLPYIARDLAGPKTRFAVMLKPQFEAGREQINKGIIKNETIRRKVVHEFEEWSQNYFIIRDKRDSEVAGSKGNRERFYLLTLKRNSTTSPGRMT